MGQPANPDPLGKITFETCVPRSTSPLEKLTYASIYETPFQ